MNKIKILVLALLCISTLNVYADVNCNKTPVKKTYTYSPLPAKQNNCSKPAEKSCDKPCPQPVYTRECPAETFLCTGKERTSLFKCMNLSETQICNAEKLQDKYETEVLSLNERIQCEKKKLYQMKKACTKGSEYRKTKREIRRLKKERNKICKCYEKQFKTTLSDQQIKEYKRYKKGKN